MADQALEELKDRTVDAVWIFRAFRSLMQLFGVKPVDIDKEIHVYPLAEIPRIKEQLERRIEQVKAAGCSPEEVLEICLQVVRAQFRTYNAQKRRRLSNVLVNGLTREERDATEHRLFIRATEELDQAHIDMLKSVGQVLSPQESMDRALASELAARGMLEMGVQTDVDVSREQDGYYVDYPAEVDTSVYYCKTALGQRFLEYLRDPEDAR